MFNAPRPSLKALFLFAVLCLTSFAGVRSANAQLGIYGEFNAINIPGDAFLGTSTAWHKGGSVGVYDNFLHIGPIGLGLDLRGGFGTANGYNSYNVLVGPRLALNPPLLPIRPYVQASVGVGGVGSHDSIGNRTQTTGRLQYGVVGGLDYTIFPHLDLRLPEITYIRTSQDQFSGGAAPVNLVGVGAGIVVRLP